MKFLLTLSLLCNFVLGFFYFSTGPESPVRVKKRPKSHLAEKYPTAVEVSPERERFKRPNKSKNLPDADQSLVRFSHQHDVEELNHQVEKMQSDRQEYLTTQLQLTPAQLETVEKLKQKYNQQSNAIYQKGGVQGEMSFDDRKRLIAVEEKLHQEISRVLGEKNWVKFQKFRQQYNKKLIQQAQDSAEPQPMMLMDL